MNNELQTWAHVGVYGIYIKDAKVLLINKSRGPYEGMFDLPGGKIEKGETLEQALRREFIEEVGCEIKDLQFLSMNEYSCEYKNHKKVLLNFHHTGTYFVVSLSSDDIKVDADGEDSLGSKFVEIKDLDNVKISPISKPMILKAIKDNFL
ncbi:MAG: NUDIX domain-containing protein [Candidatus Nomurabacteria bacterium]|nr:NUDIX domain-containing protein [Candidatus Nomurabacteria bacterium]